MAERHDVTLTQQLALLRMEYEYEREQYRQQAESMSVRRGVKRGIVWYPLTVGRSYTNSLQQLVVEVFRPEGSEQEHSFEPGKPVSFFTYDENQQDKARQDKAEQNKARQMRFTANVLLVDGDRMVVALPSGDSLIQIQNAEGLGVQLYFDEFTYRLMFDALERTIAAKKGRMAELRDIIHGGVKPATRTLQPITLPWLNESQQQAVNMVLCAKDVAVLHGPPGTGKTTTLVEAIYETLRRETQVMVCAQSNMAVDWIAAKLDERGLNVLRIGNPTRVTDRMLACTYERRFESHPQYSELWAVRRAIKQLYESKESRGESFHQKISRLKDRAAALEMGINEQLFSSAHVVACTLTGSGNRLLVGHRFSTLFIDEAAQALEASCWIAMQRADRVVLAGDHRQLPPTIKCREAIRGGLDHTMMQTIVERHPQAVRLLKVQYRMNDTIMQFSNQCFYDGLLESAPTVRYRGILDWDTPVEWVESECEDCAEEMAADGLSRVNTYEAELTISTLHDYFARIGRERILKERIDVGIISPYKGQVHLLRRLFKRDPWFKPFRHAVSIDTVDGFQGQERDIIIISLVRNNAEGEVGFLRDLRRMNVAITRAKMKLIVIGHSPTLCRQPLYRLLHKYCLRQNT